MRWQFLLAMYCCATLGAVCFDRIGRGSDRPNLICVTTGGSCAGTGDGICVQSAAVNGDCGGWCRFCNSTNAAPAKGCAGAEGYFCTDSGNPSFRCGPANYLQGNCSGGTNCGCNNPIVFWTCDFYRYDCT